MTHSFEPRFRALAGLSIAVGLAVVAGGLAGAFGTGLTLPSTLAGLVGVAFGVAYLLSPTWKIAVVTNDSGLRVVKGQQPKFELAWGEVEAVVASPSTHTCFVDGGSPERSLLVPGDGAPASYRIAERAVLYERIVASVARERITFVDTLDAAP